jgi:uncharacterized phage protein gp47/JayE
MARFTPKRFEQILTQMVARVVTRTGLSDVSDSSVIKNILAAAARQDDEQYYQMQLLLNLFDINKATGDDLDERAAEITPGIISRLQPAKATSQIVFTRTGTAGTVNIPVGTKVKTSDGVVFITSTTGQITPTSPEQILGNGVGRDSNLVSVVAEVPGDAGNVVSGTIVKFVQKPAGVDEVTNTVPAINGADKESDDSFRQRIQTELATLSRCTVDGIEAILIGETIEETGATIRFAKVVEDLVNLGNFTVYIDDGSGSAETTDNVVGEVMTQNLAGPPPGSAVGGETELFTDNAPIKTSIAPVVTSSVSGVVSPVSGYDFNPANGRFLFTAPLVAGEVITIDYTYYTGLIQLAQKIIDGDPLDRTNYPGYRAAGVRGIVDVPQVLLQTVVGVVTVEDGFDQATVITNVKEAIKVYINSLTISDDVLRNEIIAQIMNVEGVYNLTLSSPATDTIVLDDQLPRISDANITIT